MPEEAVISIEIRLFAIPDHQNCLFRKQGIGKAFACHAKNISRINGYVCFHSLRIEGCIVLYFKGINAENANGECITAKSNNKGIAIDHTTKTTFAVESRSGST